MNMIITLITTGIILLLMEIIIPGGIIGVIGILFMIAGIIMGFNQSVELGIILLFSSAIAGLFSLWAAIKLFPESPLGKKIFLDKSAKNWQGYETSNDELLGKSGKTHTQLRPSGMAIINDKRINVVTRGELIEKDEEIKVIKVEGNRIIVALE